MPHWPHAPPHLLDKQGLYMVTAGTYLKQHFFNSPIRLKLLHDRLLELATTNGWELHAWAVFSNHYHFIARSSNTPSQLGKWLAQLHQETAAGINRQDQTPNRKVWYQFWDSRLTLHKSYLARLKYVHQNPVKHGLVVQASEYAWCSAAQFERNASQAFVRSVYSFDLSYLRVWDDF